MLLLELKIRPFDGMSTMASADFSGSFRQPLGYRSLIPRQNQRPPRVGHDSFPRPAPDLPAHAPGWLSGFPVHCRVTPLCRPCIRFLFVASEFCLRLPPNPTSRRRSCLQLTVPITSARGGLPPHNIHAMPGTQSEKAALKGGLFAW